jgi:hypothetical protein
MAFWYGNTTAKASGFGNSNYTYTYPSPYDSSFSRSLVFAGFSWQVNKTVSFNVKILSGGTDTSDTIQFKVLADLLVYFISFQILLVSTASG